MVVVRRSVLRVVHVDRDSDEISKVSVVDTKATPIVNLIQHSNSELVANKASLERDN